MSVRAWELPWDMASVPHAVIDVVRGCNVTCRTCCNDPGTEAKPVAAVEAELEELLRLRRLSSIALMGGEVLMHPELLEIVRLVKGRGLHVEVCTNGLLLDAAMAAALVQAGADVIYLHIEQGQGRPDLPTGHGAAEVAALRAEKAALAAAAGLDVGLSMTAFSERSPELLEVVRFALADPHVNWLLVTLYRDVQGLERVDGDLYQGMVGTVRGELEGYRRRFLDNARVAAFLEEELALVPFGKLGSQRDPDDLRWLSYMVATSGVGPATVHHALGPSLFERGVLWLLWRLQGRYPMYQAQGSLQLRLQLVLNALLGGRSLANLGFLLRTLSAARLRTKRLLFQNPAAPAPDGGMVHCRCCPDAVLKGGRLVPVCIMDRVNPD
jgi:MoaA/NifB/PqqE/SkfB family radical SAM enzyme